MKKTFYYIFFIILIIFIISPSCFATDNTIKPSIDSSNLHIYSNCVLLVEKETGDILYEKNAYSRMYPASTTKMLTAIIVLENSYLNEVATVSSTALAAVPSSYTVAGLEVR